MHKLLGLARRLGHGVDVAVLLDREAGHRLAGLGDAVDDMLGPARLDPDHHHRGDVGVRARADHGAEVQLQILAELQATIGVGQCLGALNMARDGLAGRVGDVVDGQDDHVVAHAHAAVLAPVAHEGSD